MIKWNKWSWQSFMWLILGAITLLIKQRTDFNISKNEGSQVIDVAIVFTNKLSVFDAVLWVSFSLFGALFVLHRIVEKTKLYPLLAGRITSRRYFIWKEILIIYSWTAIYICITALGTVWNGIFTFGTVFAYIYAWFSLSLLILCLRLFEYGFQKKDTAYAFWILGAFFSTIKPIINYLPWMYGRSYSIWEHGTLLISTSSLLIMTIIIVIIYIIRMKSTDWV